MVRDYDEEIANIPPPPLDCLEDWYPAVSLSGISNTFFTSSTPLLETNVLALVRELGDSSKPRGLLKKKDIGKKLPMLIFLD